MDAPASVGITTAISTAVSAVMVALINRGAAAGAKEAAIQVERLIGADGKAGPETEIGKLKARIATVESAIGGAVSVATEFADLRRWAEQQVKGLSDRVRLVERGQQRTGSQPALIDEHARDEASAARSEAAEALRSAEAADRRAEAAERRVAELAQAREADRGAAQEIQKQLIKIDTILELLMGGSIAPGGKR